MIVAGLSGPLVCLSFVQLHYSIPSLLCLRAAIMYAIVYWVVIRDAGEPTCPIARQHVCYVVCLGKTHMSH
jgi:hypothetical protein